MEQIVQEQELTVMAAMSGSVKLLEQALVASPMVPDKSIVPVMVKELLEANAEHLPQFAKKY